jgi:SAM-dependent methyltransferase
MSGFLAEEFAALGCDVTGVDPSPVSIEAARNHAAARGLDIDYRVGSGEQLPAGNAAFDLVYCCDVLEHVADLHRVLTETARVLTPGGLYLFDTINRTLKSKVLVIKVMQQWPLTRITDAAIHNWDMFIKPAELADALARNGLHTGEMVGLAPRAKLPALVRAFISARQGGFGVEAQPGFCRAGGQGAGDHVPAVPVEAGVGDQFGQERSAWSMRLAIRVIAVRSSPSQAPRRSASAARASSMRS